MLTDETETTHALQQIITVKLCIRISCPKLAMSRFQLYCKLVNSTELQERLENSIHLQCRYKREHLKRNESYIHTLAHGIAQTNPLE